jgi:hypothetical protein
VLIHSAVVNFHPLITPEYYPGFGSLVSGSNEHLTFINVHIRPLHPTADAALLERDRAFTTGLTRTPPIQTQIHSSTPLGQAIVSQSDDGAGVGLIAQSVVDSIGAPIFQMATPATISGYNSASTTNHTYTAIVVALIGTSPTGEATRSEFIMKPMIVPAVTGGLLIGADTLNTFKIQKDQWTNKITAFARSAHEITMPAARYADIAPLLQQQSSSLLSNISATEYSAIVASHALLSTPSSLIINTTGPSSHSICTLPAPHD